MFLKKDNRPIGIPCYMDTIILILHVLLLSSKSTCENILDVSGIAESTYDFDEEIDIQNTYNNVYEEALKLEK